MGLNEIDDEIAMLERELEGLEEGVDGGGASADALLPSAMSPAAAAADDEKQARRKRKRELAAAAKALEPPAPPLALYCSICHASVNSELLMREHVLGRRHRERELEADGRWCAICKLEFTSATQLAEHETGKKHVEAAERARARPPNAEAGEGARRQADGLGDGIGIGNWPAPK